MTAITITVNVSGTPDVADRQAMLLAISQENERRVFTQQAALPSSTGAERKASYELLASAKATAEHLELINQASRLADSDSSFKALKPLWLEANDQKKAAALAALS